MVRLGLKLISPEVLMDLDHKDSMEINGKTGVLFMVNHGEVVNLTTFDFGSLFLVYCSETQNQVQQFRTIILSMYPDVFGM